MPCLGSIARRGQGVHARRDRPVANRMPTACVVPRTNITRTQNGDAMTATGSRIIVLGAGISGLATGMLLRRDGHEVTILERDPEPAPRSPRQAWESWTRDGVAQFRQPHFLQPRGRIVLGEELPDVLAALASTGGLRFDLLHQLMPPTITDRTPRDGDERFQTVMARR